MAYQASLKTVYKKLDRDEPFTDAEKSGYSNKEQALIRGIQLRDKTDKDTAKETYIDALNKSKRATKGLSSSVRKYLKDKYPKHGRVTHTVSDFEKGESKTSIRKKQKQDVKRFILKSENKTKNPVTYQRVANAEKKYPNASLGELRHGVNSKWSQEYRVKHGLNRNYK